MVSITEKFPILIVGTGNLGSVLAQHGFANPKIQVNILIRDPTKHKDIASQVEANGGKVFKGDLNDYASLQEATKGIHTVLVTVSTHDENIWVNGQKALIDASVKNGVKKFFPIEYGITDAHIDEEEASTVPICIWRNTVRSYLKSQPIKPVIVRNGLWNHYFLAFFSDFGYYGDGDQKINFTDIEDLGEFIIQSVIKEDVSGDVYFAGTEVSMNEAAKIYSKVKGTPVEAKKLGSIEELQVQANGARAGGNFQAILFTTLKLWMFSGKAYEKNSDNKRFPSMKTTSLEDTFKKAVSTGK